MSRHTPGPWAADPCDGCVMVLSSDGETVATVHGGNEKTDSANAALIAAAPDMYAALRDLLSDAEAADMAQGPHAGSLIEARKSLAKAEGRS
jgi:hypothetical protein